MAVRYSFSVNLSSFVPWWLLCQHIAIWRTYPFGKYKHQGTKDTKDTKFTKKQH